MQDQEGITSPRHVNALDRVNVSLFSDVRRGMPRGEVMHADGVAHPK